MKYPNFCKRVIDITKAPYYADNTGKIDCTNVLRKAIDDCLVGYITGLEKLRKELLELYEKQGGNVYVGAEVGRVINGNVYMTFPKEIPSYRVIYFPKGTYLVSDTITYTFDNLKAPQQANYTCELCRHIHIIGESKESTIIRLADNSNGFEKGKSKPVLSFNKSSREFYPTSNCAQMNTLEDITIDCGSGNEGAIGVLYASSNCGRIENVTVKGNHSFVGINFDCECEACVYSVDIRGFDYGMKCNFTAPVILDEVDLSENYSAGILAKNGNFTCRKVNSGNIPTLFLQESENGRYYLYDRAMTVAGETKGNFVVYAKENSLVDYKPIPKNYKSENFVDWAYVDDFGAIGDGKTDDTIAIQMAMNSGKKVVLFGAGNYLISHTIKVPATVQTIDFCYAELSVGRSLLIGEMQAMFDICESSNETFFAEHCSPDISGFFRMFKQSAKRTVVLKDMCMSVSLYFNTESGSGSEVYFDNIFTHTEHYSQNVILAREDYVAVLCRMIPVETHGQKVYASNLNIERADIELLNDASDVYIDGYKVEGPGVLVRTINGGKTQINILNAAWWGNKIKENGLFEIVDSEIDVTAGHVFCYPSDEEYCLALTLNRNGNITQKTLSECSIALEGFDALGRQWGRLIENIVSK